MGAQVQTFKTAQLLSGFSGRGRIRLLKTYRYKMWDALPQTSERLCLIDGPECKANGERPSSAPGVDMTGYDVDHGNGRTTRGYKGGELVWENVTIEKNGKLQFHYMFLPGEFRDRYNCFAQLRAIGSDGKEQTWFPFAQTMNADFVQAVPGTSYLSWTAHPPIDFPDGFRGNLKWIVVQGETMKSTQNAINTENAGRHPSGLALDFISIIS